MSYALTLAGDLLVMAFIIDTLAEMFGGQKNFNSAFKVAAYAPTASWVAGVFTLHPGAVGADALILGLYSLYLLYLGLPALMRTPPDKAIGYVIAVIVAAIIVSLLIFLDPGALVFLSGVKATL